MRSVVLMVVVGLIAATELPPVAAHERDDLNKVVVLQCETETDGSIGVRSSGVTTATGVTISSGQRCATAIASVLQAGMILQHRSTTVDDTTGEVSFNFVFLGYDTSHDDDDDDEESE